MICYALRLLVAYAWFNLDRYHTTVEKFENAALFFSTVKPIVHANPSRKHSFSKRLFKSQKFENAQLAFQCGQKTFLKTELFVKDGLKIIMWFPWTSFPKHKSKVASDCCALNSSGVVWMVKNMVGLLDETTVFKFLRRNVGGVLTNKRLCLSVTFWKLGEIVLKNWHRTCKITAANSLFITRSIVSCSSINKASYLVHLAVRYQSVEPQLA